jgi:hypothetical protein
MRLVSYNEMLIGDLVESERLITSVDPSSLIAATHGGM